MDVTESGTETDATGSTGATGSPDVAAEEAAPIPSPAVAGEQGGAGSDATGADREGEVAADYLEELLDIADLDGDIDIDIDGDRAVVSLVGGDLGHLVGTDGAVVTALQDLTRLAVTRETGERSRLVVDVDGYRDRRRAEITAAATEAVELVRAGADRAPLPAMSAFERKIAHDVVAGLGATSGSEGEDPGRHVVVSAS